MTGDKLQQIGYTIHQYPTCTKAGDVTPQNISLGKTGTMRP